MLNNLTNFLNIITSKMIKKVPEATDLIPLGTRDSRYGGKYKPTGITVADFIDSIPVPPIGVQSVVAGTNVTVNNADPLNPIVNSLPDGVQSIVAGTNITVNNTDPANPIVNATSSGLIGSHVQIKPQSGFYYSNSLSLNVNLTSTTNGALILSPFIPAYNLSISEIVFNVTTLFVGGLLKAVIYSDLNGLPNTKLYESATVTTDTTGIKTLTGVSFTFNAGETYWVSMLANNNTSGVRCVNIGVNSQSNLIASNAGTANFTSWYINSSFAAPPATVTGLTIGNLNGGPVPYLVFRSI